MNINAMAKRAIFSRLEKVTKPEDNDFVSYTNKESDNSVYTDIKQMYEDSDITLAKVASVRLRYFGKLKPKMTLQEEVILLREKNAILENKLNAAYQNAEQLELFKQED